MLRKYESTSNFNISNGDSTKFRKTQQRARTPELGTFHGPVAWDAEARMNDFLRAIDENQSRFLWVAGRLMRGQEQEIEDVVQEALLRAFKNLWRFRAESQMATWLRAIVQNAAREHMRNRRGKVDISLDYSRDGEDDCAYEVPDARPNPEEHCVRRERQQIVQAAIGAMAPTRRRLVEVCVLDETPYVEAATILSLSPSAIKAQMFRSRRELRIAITNQIAP